MRVLVFLRAKYFREFLSTGAFDGLDPDETFFLTEGNLREPLASHNGLVGSIPAPSADRTRAYARIREIMFTSYRSRSRTVQIKLMQRPRLQRWLARLGSAPVISWLRIRRLLRSTGLREDLVETIGRLAPDLVVTPSSGVDASEVDVLRAAGSLGVPTLGLMYNWDNLSSKSVFPAKPDYLGVIGSQSAQHATDIHGIAADRVTVVGSPYIDTHFRHRPASSESPFGFRYVLFAGCYQPFDEASALKILDRAVAASGLDLKVVYLPHPRRLPRREPDFVDERALKHVLIEPRMREQYDHAWPGGTQVAGLSLTPLPVGAYPALLENAEFVVCPLSTLMLEAAIFRRRVLVIAYHDGLHPTSPGVAIDYLHFEGVDDVDTFSLCRREADLQSRFVEMAEMGGPDVKPPKEQMDFWIYHDDRPFSRRLADLVADIGRREGSRAERESPVSAIARV